MYEYDWRTGNKSMCTICRKIITSKPNRVYGNYPKEKMFYEVPKDSLQPNINGKKLKPPTDARVNSASAQEVGTINSVHNIYSDEDDDSEDEDEDQDSLVEFYEDRLADLERQLEEYSERSFEFERLRSELSTTKLQLSQTKRELNDRNLRLEKLITQKINLEEEFSEIKTKLAAATEELESYKYSKMASEVTRLANHISSIQKESYYKNLLKDTNTTREFLIGMLSGFEKKHAEAENEKNQLLRENRMLRIYKETAEKRIRQVTSFNGTSGLVLKPKPPANPYDDAGETELDEPISNDFADDQENTRHSQHPEPVNPFAVKPQSTKMVPKSLPKGFSIPKSSSTASTGTGKRQKVLQLPNGQQYFI